MRILSILFATMMSTAAASAAPCALTAADFEALQASRSGIKDQAQVDAQPPDRQNLLCATRSKWARITSGKFQDDDMKGVSIYYLSPEEGEAFAKVQRAYLRARLENMSDAEWQRTRQKLIDDAKRK